ncbi:SGNH/GDSL hydrolase family protein [Martelella limonii]|uniref:SGNH/GDSL hydrolase family protein n=1 Tax=Martelella limonii TaxID=1647649 RepID=UPI001580CD42|nr:SGNH/GDSL hydrolase family protein [Martelella limonii]
MADIFTYSGIEIWASQNPDGSARGPNMGEMQVWSVEMEASVKAFVNTTGGTAKTTRALLYADLAHDAGALAWVYADSTAAYNGIYIKSGVSGSGSWTRILSLPYQYARATNTGGTNAITATTDIPLTTGMLVTLPVVNTNTGNMTVVFNSGAAVPIRSASGNQITAGGVVAGMQLLGVYTGTEFRLISDQASSAILAVVEDAKNVVVGVMTTVIDPQFANISTAEAFAPTLAPDYIRTAGYAASGDGGGALYKKAASEPSHDGKFFITLDDAVTDVWYELAETKARPEYFGTGRAALTSAKGYTVAKGTAILLGPNDYNIGDTLPGFDFEGVTIEVDPGASITGAVLIYGGTPPRVTAELTINYEDSTGVDFSHTFTPSYTTPQSQKDMWLGEGDIDRSFYSNVDAINMEHATIAWPSSDTWTPSAAPTGDASEINWPTSSDATWRASFTPMRGGQELNCVFGAGSYQRAAFIRTSRGYFVFYTPTGSGSGLYAYKLTGDSVVSSAVDWIARSDHLSMQPANAMWTIRIIDHRTWSVLLNGMEVIGKQDIGDGIIYDAGFGSYGDASASVKIELVSKNNRSISQTPAPSRLLIVGDSISAPIQGDWPSQMRQTMDGSFGLRLLEVVNVAVAGANSSDMVTEINNNGTRSCNYGLVLIGTNDIQGGASAETTLGNLGFTDGDGGLLSLLRASFCEPIVAIPPLWYTQALSGQGGETFNYAAGARTRAAIVRLCAQRGIKCIDLQQALGPMIANYIALADVDNGLRDNIHGTLATNRLIAMAFARALADKMFRKMTPEISPRSVPSLFQNGWSSASARLRVSEDGVVTLSGGVNTGTKTDGTVFYVLPVNLRPSVDLVFITATNDAGDPARIDVQADGNITIRNISTATYVVLDGISWKAE